MKLLIQLSMNLWDQWKLIIQITHRRVGTEKKLDILKVELTNPEDIAPELKEIASSLSGLDKGQQEVVKLLASHVEILDEIRFLEADKMTIMKEKLIKLREEDKDKKIPWESIISLVTTIGSI